MNLSEEEKKTFNRMTNLIDIDNFRADAIDGMIMNLIRGKLGFISVSAFSSK